MDQINKFSLYEKNRPLISLLILALSIFIITYIVLNVVEIQNRIKSGRYIGQDVVSKNTISVSATGEVFAKPDLGLTTLSVVNEAKTVESATSENTAKMNAVIKSVKDQGVEEKDIKTTSYNIYPRYDYDNRLDIAPSDRRVLVGYEVSQSLQVKIRDLDKVGSIIQAATQAGANQVGDLQFTLDDEDALKAQARSDAIAQAKEKAKNIAAELDVRLIRIVSFNENDTMPYYGKYDMVAEYGIGGSGPALDIETGENRISVTVNISYEID